MNIMKRSTLCLVLLQVYFQPSLITTCRTTLSKTFQPFYVTNRGALSPRYGCYFFRPPQGRIVIEAATITCSNVSSDVYLNYTYEAKSYPQDLVIANSTIPTFPTNSSLTLFKTVRKLVLENLGIKVVSSGAFQNLEELQAVDLSFNQLETVPEDVFGDTSSLKVLDLSHNFIKRVQKESVCSLVQLKELYLNQNQITELEDGIFKNLTSMETLDISDNPLVVLGDVGFKSLKKLIARNMLLHKFEVDLTKLMISDCDLFNNSLEVVDFHKFPPMKRINLAKNSLKTLHNFDGAKIEQVLLNNNSISTLEVLPTGIRFLDLSHNQIAVVNIEYSTHDSELRYLNLNFNEIALLLSGTFWNLHNLKTLSIQHNQLSALGENTFVDCPNLQNVDLSHNEISHIGNSAFHNLEELKNLKLSYNKLQKLSPGMVSNGTTLRNLRVDHNHIVKLSTEELLYHFKNLKKMWINGNPWSCESLKNVVYWLNVFNIDIADNTSVIEDNVRGISCKFNKLS